MLYIKKETDRNMKSKNYLNEYKTFLTKIMAVFLYFKNKTKDYSTNNRSDDKQKSRRCYIVNKVDSLYDKV